MDTDEREVRLAALAAQIAEVEERRPIPEQPYGRRRTRSGRAAASLPADAESTSTDGQRTGAAAPAGAPPGSASDKEQTAEARAICLRLLAVAPRPRAGLAQAMKRKEIPDHIAEAVLDRLTEVGLIDDVAYAQSFVRVKHRDRALGRTALRTELRKLGVDEEIMSVAVSVVDATAERERAAELVAKRLDAAMAAGPVAARRRLLGLLSRRGYGFEIAVPVVEEALTSYSGGAEVG